jgi:threonine dehydratase
LPGRIQPPAPAEAAARLRGALLEARLLESEQLNNRPGSRAPVKAECLQPTGSFNALAAAPCLI